jgi:hypothetical protein
MRHCRNRLGENPERSRDRGKKRPGSDARFDDDFQIGSNVLLVGRRRNHRSGVRAGAVRVRIIFVAAGHDSGENQA